MKYRKYLSVKYLSEAVDSSVKMPNSTVETKKQFAAWLYHHFPSLMGDRLLFYSVAA